MYFQNSFFTCFTPVLCGFHYRESKADLNIKHSPGQSLRRNGIAQWVPGTIARFAGSSNLKPEKPSRHLIIFRGDIEFCGKPSRIWLPHIDVDQFQIFTIWNKTSASYAHTLVQNSMSGAMNSGYFYMLDLYIHHFGFDFIIYAQFIDQEMMRIN